VTIRITARVNEVARGNGSGERGGGGGSEKSNEVRRMHATKTNDSTRVKIFLFIFSSFFFDEEQIVRVYIINGIISSNWIHFYHEKG